jgi:hypothetical protein
MMSKPSLPRAPLNRATLGALVQLQHVPATTSLAHTQEEVKPSLWGRILRNEP